MGAIPGPVGPAGPSVVSAAINSAGHLILSYDNGTTTDGGVIPFPPFVRPPTNLTAKTVSDTSVELTYTPSPDTTTAYLQRAPGTGSGGGWATLPANNSTDYTDTGLSPGTEYSYRVMAYKGVYSKADQIVVTTTGQSASPPPSGTTTTTTTSPPPATLTNPTPPPVPAGALTYRSGVNWGASATPVGATFRSFVAFRDGEIPAGQAPQVRLADGVAVPAQQVDNVSRWPSGALRSAVVAWQHPAIQPNTADLVAFYAAAPGSPGGQSVSVLTSGHDYQIQVVTAGSALIMSVNDSVAAGKVRVVRSGAAETVFEVWGDLGPQMWCKLWISVAASGAVTFEHEVYANRVAAAAAVAITSATLADGATVIASNTTPFTLYTRNKFAIYDADGRAPVVGGPDLSQVIWQHPLPVKGDPRTLELEDAKIVWPNQWSSDYINAFQVPAPIAYAPNQNLAAIFPDGIDGTGNHDWLGPMASYDVRALLTGRYEFLQNARMKALGSWCQTVFWVAENTVGLPPVFTKGSYPGLGPDRTSVGWGLAATLSMTGGGNSGTTSDASHSALWWWGIYLMTGSEQALSNIQEQAVGVIGANVASYGTYQRNPIFVPGGKQYFGVYSFFPQSRAVGWEIRNLSNAHWVTPDAHPMKTYLDDLTQVQYDAAAAGMAANEAQWGALAVWATPQQVSPWMDNYRVTSLLMDYRRGRVTLDHLTMRHVWKNCYGKLKDGSIRRGAGAYRVGYGIGPNPAGQGIPNAGQQAVGVAQAWTDVYGFQDPPGLTLPLVDPNPALNADGTLLNHNQGTGEDAQNDVSFPLTHTYVGHYYETIALVAASCGLIAAADGGDTSSVLYTYAKYCHDYLAPLIDSQYATEALWGTTGSAQAWRIRPR